MKPTLGPDEKYLNNRTKDYSVDDSQRNNFYLVANRLLPFIHKDDLYSDTAGIGRNFKER